jgi:hypothetical protein
VQLHSGIVSEIRRLVADLASGRYGDIVADGRGGRLSADDLERAVVEYGRKLIPLPEEGIPLVDFYAHDADPGAASLDVPLWTEEEGRSDLTLSIAVTQTRGLCRVEIDDLRVL